MSIGQQKALLSFLLIIVDERKDVGWILVWLSGEESKSPFAVLEMYLMNIETKMKFFIHVICTF